MCRKVTFINTSIGVAWIHLAIFLKDHVIHIPVLSICLRGKDKSVLSLGG